MRAEARARLLDAIAKARLWLDGLITGRFTSTAEIALHERCSERAVRITLSLAFLAPAIVRTAVGPAAVRAHRSSFSELPISGRNSCTSQTDHCCSAFAREVDGSIFNHLTFSAPPPTAVAARACPPLPNAAFHSGALHILMRTRPLRLPFLLTSRARKGARLPPRPSYVSLLPWGVAGWGVAYL